MRPLLTQGEVRRILGGISYSTLSRMLRAGEFVSPVLGGQGKQLKFCPDSVEEWIRAKARQPPQESNAPTVTTRPMAKQQDKDRENRIRLARQKLNAHRKQK